MPPRSYVGFHDLTDTAKRFLKNNLNYIADNDFDTLYSHIATPALAQAVTRMLLKAGIDVKKYLTTIPNSIKHILEPETRFEPYDDMLEEWRKKLFMGMGIPKSIIEGCEEN